MVAGLLGRRHKFLGGWTWDGWLLAFLAHDLSCSFSWRP